MTRFRKQHNCDPKEMRRVRQHERQMVQMAERWAIAVSFHQAETETRYYTLSADDDSITVRVSDHMQVYSGDYCNIDPYIDEYEKVKEWIQTHGTKRSRWTAAQAHALAKKLRQVLPEKYEVEVVQHSQPIVYIGVDGYRKASRDARGWCVEIGAEEELRQILKRFGYRVEEEDWCWNLAELIKAKEHIPQGRCGRCAQFELEFGRDAEGYVRCRCRAGFYVSPTFFCARYQPMENEEETWERWQEESEKDNRKEVQA